MGNEIKVGHMLLGPIETNCYYIYREGGDKTCFFDPADSGNYIYDKLTDMGLEVEEILLTHGHFDHIAGGDDLRNRSGARIKCLDAEKELIENPELNVSMDFMGYPVTLTPDGYFKDGDELTIAGDIRCKVLATPGHTKGGCCFYIEEGGILISGDTLFEGSVGRTDFPGGSMSTLVRSLQEKLMVLPDETKVYPGHGAETTIGFERKYNPYATGGLN
ncbi:Glyoxylase, beta-lactamase superfamily II [Lachnospiraceae bacterium XPB1003]|nr:Glyoxylase, beta-lactamase superfamily II [Lachnospiraceae bacterium XPB1003]